MSERSPRHFVVQRAVAGTAALRKARHHLTTMRLHSGTHGGGSTREGSLYYRYIVALHLTCHIVALHLASHIVALHLHLHTAPRQRGAAFVNRTRPALGICGLALNKPDPEQ